MLWEYAGSALLSLGPRASTRPRTRELDNSILQQHAPRLPMNLGRLREEFPDVLAQKPGTCMSCVPFHCNTQSFCDRTVRRNISTCDPSDSQAELNLYKSCSEERTRRCFDPAKRRDSIIPGLKTMREFPPADPNAKRDSFHNLHVYNRWIVPCGFASPLR